MVLPLLVRSLSVLNLRFNRVAVPKTNKGVDPRINSLVCFESFDFGKHYEVLDRFLECLSNACAVTDNAAVGKAKPLE